MQTTLRSAFITDLLLPPPHSLPNLSPSQITQIGHSTALSILQSSEAFIRSNPLVTNVRRLHSASDSKNYIDVPAFCNLFYLQPQGDPRHGISSEWEQYEITDKLSWGLGSSDLIYVTAMRSIPGGFESVTSPGSGVKIYGRFEILHPSELGRHTSSSANHTPPVPSGASSRPGTPSKQHHDYNSGAPNTVPGWPLDDDSRSSSTRPTTTTTTAAETGVIHFIEHNETRCNALLGVYIKATTAKSHQTMHENFKRKWGEIVKAALSEAHAAAAAAGRSGSSAVAGVQQGREKLGDGAEVGQRHYVGAGERKYGGREGEGLDERRRGSRSRSAGGHGRQESRTSVR